MEWSRKKTIELIKEFENHECLWNAASAEHRDVEKRKAAWRDIGKNLEVNAAESEKKIKSLLATYRRERRKYFSSKRSENGVDHVYKSKWFAYNYMQFLHCVNRPKRMREPTPHFIKVPCSESDPLETNYEGNAERYWDKNNIHVNNKNSEECRDKVEWTERKRLKPIDQMDVAYETMQTIMKDRLEMQKDEYSLYGEVIAHKLRKLSTEYERNVVQFKINQILFQASMGAFRQTSIDISAQPNSTETTFASSREYCPSDSSQTFMIEENSELRKYMVSTAN